MAPWFDDGRLDDEAALARADDFLRHLAESGARVRREATAAAEPMAEALAQTSREVRPRAVIAAGPDSRLLRAVLEPWCPVPFVAWPAPSLPGWAGSLDLVVVLAPVGRDTGTASAVAEAVRRGCQVVVAAPEGSMVAEHAAGRHTTLLPTTTGDRLAIAVVVLDFLARISLGPDADTEVVATALDDVAIACSPSRDISVNPAKILALGLGEANPLLWGGTPLAARAARRVAEAIRRSTGRTALAADVDQLLPVIHRTPRRDVFADPFEDQGDGDELRPTLVVFDDASDEPSVCEQRARLTEAAEESDVRVELVSGEGGSEVARYASLVAAGSYAATYLAVGLGTTPR